MAEHEECPDGTDLVIICPFTGGYCTGDFCEDYGCAKEAGFWDDDDV